MLKDYITRKNYDIVCLTETWNNSKRNYGIRGLTSQMKDRNKGKEGGGAAILTQPNVKLRRRLDLETPNLEAVFIDTCINKKCTTVGSVYIPPHKIKDLDILDTVLDKISNPNLILTGDFNASSPRWGDHTSSISWKMGEQLEDLCIKHGLHICNNLSFTREQGDEKSSPDVTMARTISCPIKWYVDKQAHLRTDHHPITIDVDEGRQPSQQKWDLKNVDWSVWSDHIGKSVDTWLQQHRDTQDANVAADAMEKIFLETAQEVIPTKTTCQHLKPYFNDQLRELLKVCKTTKAAYYRRSDPNNWEKYQTAVEEFVTAYNQAQQEYWRSFCEDLLCNQQDIWQKKRLCIKRC